ncbi:hypothetical protein [Streptomyces sp. NPDC058955]|uniref:hypothetical protein n=1 Tax=unclassified Streptomyces TaxID=2593676 RepID=UPI0036684AFE
MWRHLGRSQGQTLTDALDNPDGSTLYRAQQARADAEEQRRRAAEREAQRLVCTRCGRKFSDERWEGITVQGTAVRAGDRTVCGPCRADDVAREEAVAEPLASRLPPRPAVPGEAGRRR